MITLLTDFGSVDPYVAQMKGVILSKAANLQIVDISHDVANHNVAMGSYLLETVVPWFPRGSIHIAVVDPGVGGSRLPVVAACDDGVLVGPDNGLLFRAAEKLGFKAAYRIESALFKGEKISSTFHGRDVFAHAAAMIASGHRVEEAGQQVSTLNRPDFPSFHVSNSQVSCRVIYVDSFGNVVTSIPERQAERLGFREGAALSIVLRGARFDAVMVRSYSDLANGKVGVLLGSQGYLEIAMKEDSAAKYLKLNPSAEVSFHLS